MNSGLSSFICVRDMTNFNIILSPSLHHFGGRKEKVM